MRSEQEVKDLLRHVARSLQPAGPVESVAGNTSNDMSTTIAAALNRMAQQKKFFSEYANKAPTLVEAFPQLDIRDSENPWIEGLGPNINLRFWQPSDISWVVKGSVEIGGCILWDDMGLGKTLQACGVICHIKNEREKGNDSVGQPKLSLVIGPIAVLNFWKRMVETLLSENFQAHLYYAGEKTRISSKESLSSLKSPGYHVLLPNSND
ncbi:hypothetical protein ACHAP3_006978 [Botrytis cinerea]